MKKQELVNQETSTAVTEVVNMSEWGDIVVEAKDLILPKILLQQAMSEAVKQRVAFDGDYLNTLTNSVASNDKGEVSILPFFCNQYHTVEKWNGKKYEWVKAIPQKVGDGILPFEETIGGERFKNSHVYEFFCIVEGQGTPAIIAFKSTSHKAGQQLFNQMYLQNPEMGRTPAHNWITLGRVEDSNKDNDKYFKMIFSIGKESSKEDIASCLKWIPIIKKAQYKTVEEKVSAPVTETRF